MNRLRHGIYVGNVPDETGVVHTPLKMYKCKDGHYLLEKGYTQFMYYPRSNASRLVLSRYDPPALPNLRLEITKYLMGIIVSKTTIEPIVIRSENV